MSKSKQLYIFGYAGHAYVVLDVALANGFLVKGYFDRQKVSEDPYKIEFLGDEHLLTANDFEVNAFFFPAMGSNGIRQKLIRFIEGHGLMQTTLIHPSASVSSQASIGASSLVSPNVVVNSMTKIGKGCIINSGALVEHECKIGDFSHIAPGAVLAGKVKVGTNVFVGANAVVKQGITIGDNVTVGAGAVVLRDVPKGETWVGNPAKNLG